MCTTPGQSPLPTIEALIRNLEVIKKEHGDLPVLWGDGHFLEDEFEFMLLSPQHVSAGGRRHDFKRLVIARKIRGVERMFRRDLIVKLRLDIAE